MFSAARRRPATAYVDAVGPVMVAGVLFMALGIVITAKADRRPSASPVFESAAKNDPGTRGFGPLTPSALGPPASADGLRAITLNPPLEYDGRSRADILAGRSAQVGREPDLFAALGGIAYAPSEQVFGHIEDGKPWWGLVGASFFGTDERSVEGPSRESLFVENPYLLVGVAPSWAMHVGEPYPAGVVPHAVMPMPQSLRFDVEGRRGRARFEFSSFLRETLALGGSREKTMRLTVVAYNAADLGLPYVALDADQSSGVAVPPLALALYHDSEQLKTRAGCRVAGGCTDAAFGPGGLFVIVRSIPATLVVRLWRTRPSAMTDAPAAWFVVELV